MAYNQMRLQAERDVRGAMLLEKVAELENARGYRRRSCGRDRTDGGLLRVTPEEIRASLSQQQGGEENIANSLRTQKSGRSFGRKRKNYRWRMG